MTHKVSIISHADILALHISPSVCMEGIEESFRIKSQAQLKPKISLHPQGDDFFNTMPCMLPSSIGRFAVKEVRRIAGQVPSLSSEIMLYDSHTGRLLALLDGDWITTMRTGAVAALAVRMFEHKGNTTYSFIGLGNTARATALCILAGHKEGPVTFRLLRYKDQAEDFKKRFSEYPQLCFEDVDSPEQLIGGADVVLSCLTAAPSLICPDDSLYRKGVVVVPVHTRGFQNCDLFFDKVFGDDKGHIEGFRYFSRFHSFAEMSDVMTGNCPGRESDDERILCYNIGLGLHDALFASRIYDMMDLSSCQSFEQVKETGKFWI